MPARRPTIRDRESIQMAMVAAARAERVTRPEMPAVKRGSYSFVATERAK